MQTTQTSSSGSAYPVWFCLDLNSGSWNEEAVVPSSGKTTGGTDLGATRPRKFYRVGLE